MIPSTNPANTMMAIISKPIMVILLFSPEQSKCWVDDSRRLCPRQE
jgi:hypothetical protein